MTICGPKLSICGILLSIWGVIQLSLMGVFFYFRALALSDDLAIDENKIYKTPDEFYMDADKSYKQNAFNCWIAACLYLITLAFSGHQFWLNSRSSLRI